MHVAARGKPAEAGYDLHRWLSGFYTKMPAGRPLVGQACHFVIVIGNIFLSQHNETALPHTLLLCICFQFIIFILKESYDN